MEPETIGVALTHENVEWNWVVSSPDEKVWFLYCGDRCVGRISGFDYKKDGAHIVEALNSYEESLLKAG